MSEKHGRAVKWLAGLLGTAAALLTATCILQTGWSHREEQYAPEGPRAELTALLNKPQLTEGDYELLFRQTGLARTAVDELLAQGEEGRQTILETQEGFCNPPEAQCVSLIGGRFTCEDLLLDEAGKKIPGVPLCPLRPGDILVSFSTHTLGWRHGHAGLVIGPGRVLEAVQLGVNSYMTRASHWQSYSTFMVLRVRDAAARLGAQVAEEAARLLNDVPYSLLPGLTSPKDGPIEGAPGVHCAYLPWYAWNRFGVDLDANGGPIVTVGDLARSPELEVVQVFGMDPVEARDHRIDVSAAKKHPDAAHPGVFLSDFSWRRSSPF